MSDEELTKAIYEAMQVPYLSERHDAIKQFITADRKRVALEAKIEAAEHIQYTMVKPACGYYYEILPYAIPEYIAELKAQQEDASDVDLTTGGEPKVEYIDIKKGGDTNETTKS